MKIMTTPDTRTTVPHLPDARIVGDALVASLPDAMRPVVWRLPLGQAKASALEVQDGGGSFKLVMKSPDGETQEVAQYAAQPDAVRALMAISQAMFAAHGYQPAINAALPQAQTHYPAQASYPAQGLYSQRRPRRWKTWLAVAVAALVILFLLTHGPRRVTDDAPASAPGQSAPAASTPAETGVPQSADSFLQQQGQ